jgi:hypothetical protein
VRFGGFAAISEDCIDAVDQLIHKTHTEASAGWAGSVTDGHPATAIGQPGA